MWKSLLIISLVATSLVVDWFHKGLLFAVGEESIPFHNLTQNLNIVRYVWRPTYGGYPDLFELPRLPMAYILEFLSKIGLPSFLIQAILFWVLIIIGTISIFFVTRNLLKNDKNKEIISLVAALFYLFNPYSMNQIWGRALLQQFFPFALLPFFLWMVILGINRRKFLYGIIAIIASFILSETFNNVSYVITFWMMVGVYLIFFLLRIAENKKDRIFALVFSLAVLISWIIVQSWWLLPIFEYSHIVGKTSPLYLNTQTNVDDLKGVSQFYPFPFLIRLQHRLSFYDEGGAWGPIYGTLTFTIMSWILPICVGLSYFYLKKNKYYLFLVGLFILSLFIALGANPPFGNLFISIFKSIPYLQGYRNPFEKIGILFTIPYSILFASGLIFLGSRFNKKMGIIISLLILLPLITIYLWPMWTGQFAGGLKMNVWVQVPDYYKQADQWLSENAQGYRILTMPIITGDSIVFDWEHPYRGTLPDEFMFSTPVIPTDPYYTRKFPVSFYKEFKDGKLDKLLDNFAIKFIVLHHDFTKQTTWDIMDDNATEHLLSIDKKISKIQTFGGLDIYKVDLDKKVQRIYSPDIDLKFNQINPTQFKITVPDNSSNYSIYFLDLFDNDWKLFINNQEVQDHYKVFDYANGWKINKSRSSEIILKYEPQEIVDKNLKLAILYILLLSTLLIGILINKKIRSKIL